MEDYIINAREAYNKGVRENDGLNEAPPQTKEELQNKIFFVSENDNPENYREINNIVPTGCMSPNELKYVRMAQKQLANIEYIQDHYGINLAKSGMFFDRLMKFIIHSSKSKRGFATRSLNRQEVVQDENVSQLQKQGFAGQSDKKGFLSGQLRKWFNNSTQRTNESKVLPDVPQGYRSGKRGYEDDDFW